MHELSIAESILDAVKKEVSLHSGVYPVRVGVRIGAFTAIDADSLSFCFESVLVGTPWAALQLDVHRTPARRVCSQCSHSFAMEDYNAICPSCSSLETIADGGDELEMEYLEVETDGTPAAQVESLK